MDTNEETTPPQFAATQVRVQAFRRALEGESERGVFLVGAAYLEGELEALLRAYFIFVRASHGITDGGYEKSTDSLFTGYGPLSSFAAKSDMVLALGLMYEWEHRQLRLVRKTRNNFAHNLETTGFSSADVMPLIQKLLDSRNVTRESVTNKVTRLSAPLITRELVLNAPGISADTKRDLMRLTKEDPYKSG